MKNLILPLLAFLTIAVHAQRKPKIKGNKNVITVTEDLPAFNSIELKDDIDIMLQSSSSEGYSLLADDNLIDVLKFRVVDSTLVISSFYKITSKKKLDITIKYYELSSIIMSDGKIKMVDQLRTDHLAIDLKGKAKLEMNASVSSMDILMDGNSSGDFNIEADSLHMSLKDRIDVGIYAVSETNIITLEDNASAKMEGSTINFGITQLGSSNLRAQKLQAETVSVDLEGSSSARVYASDIVELTSRGSSKTYVSGDGKIELLEFLDTSELHKQK